MRFQQSEIGLENGEQFEEDDQLSVRREETSPSERSVLLMALNKKVSTDCSRIREKLDWIESGMKEEIRKEVEDGRILQEEIRQNQNKVDHGQGGDMKVYLDLLKKSLMKDMEAQRKVEEWNSIVLKIEEMLEDLELKDLNENDVFLTGTFPLCGSSVGQVKVEGMEVTGGGGTQSTAGSQEEGGEEDFQDIADPCRKEILCSEETGGQEDQDISSFHDCFEKSGLEELTFSSECAKDDLETPGKVRSAVIGPDGIIEPASESDTEDEEEDPGLKVKFPQFSAGQSLRCEVLEVVSTVELLVREERRVQEFYQLYNNLQTFYNMMDLETPSGWREGACCAYRSREKGWVRARLVAVEGMEATLHCGDIGDVIQADIKDLQPLEDQFSKEDFFSFTVKLPDLVPAGSSRGSTVSWSWDSKVKVEENFGSQPAIVQITGRDSKEFSWFADICFEVKEVTPLSSKTQLVSMKEMLLAEGFALGGDLAREDREEVDTEDRKILAWLPPAFPSSSQFSGVVHHVDWEGKLWVTSYPEGTRETFRIDTSLLATNLTRGSEQDLSLSDWRTGEACLSRYLNGPGWHRATVLENSNSASVRVRFVDYGTEVVTHKDGLRRNISCQEVPAQAFPVRLNVRPSSNKWEEKELKFLHETAVDRLARFEVLEPHSEGWLVNIEIPELHLSNLGQFLTQNGFSIEGEPVVDSNCKCHEIIKMRRYLPPGQLDTDRSLYID